jgi:acyl-CoA thioester hydrolase
MLPFEHTHELRVRYAETDAMGVVWHGNYLSYFESARTEAMRHTGLPSYRELEDAGIMMPVVEIGVNFHAPARYDDLLRVTARVSEPPRARIRFDYEVTRGETRIAEGFTVLAFMDAQTRRPCRPPKAFLKFFA